MSKQRKLKIAGATVLALAVAATVLAVSMSQPKLTTGPSRPSLLAWVPVPTLGKIAHVNVKDGDLVVEGQPVVELDSSGYEADLAKAETQLGQLQSQTQNAIQPMQMIPGMTGILPSRLPKTQYVTVPVNAPARPVARKAAPVAGAAKPGPVVEDPYQKALGAQKASQSAVDRATQDLAKATTAMSDAQKARDALRPKETQAAVDASEAAKKADAAPGLLAQGVISKNRSDELIASRESTQKALDAIRDQVSDADKALSDAKSKVDSAQSVLSKATGDLRSTDDLLAKAAALPAPQPAPVAPTRRADPVVKPVQTTKVVMRRMPQVVRTEEPPAIPVKVFVDQKAMQTTEPQIEELLKRIADLKSRIDECQVRAPANGIFRIAPDGTITIERPA